MITRNPRMSETASLHPRNLSAPLPSYGESEKAIPQVVREVAEHQAQMSPRVALDLVHDNPELFSVQSQTAPDLTPDQQDQLEAKTQRYENQPEIFDGAHRIAEVVARVSDETAESRAKLADAEARMSFSGVLGKPDAASAEAAVASREHISGIERDAKYDIKAIEADIADRAHQRVHDMFGESNDNLSDFWREGDVSAYKYPKDIIVSVVAPRPAPEPVIEPAAKSSAEPTARIPQHLQKRAAKARAAALKSPEPAEETPKAPEPETVRPAPEAADVPTELERIELDLNNAKRLGDIDGVAKLTLRYQNYREDNDLVQLPDTRNILETSEPEQISPDDPEAPSFRMTLEARKGALGVTESNFDELTTGSISPESLKFSIGLSEKANHGEDSSLVNPSLGLFGVFDGMGSGQDPKLASGTAADAVQRVFLENEEPKSINDAINLMKTAFNEALYAIAATGVPHNITTAVVTKVIEVAGHRYAIFGNAGDSRSFIFHTDGSYESVTTDQSRGNVIYNGIGLDGEGNLKREWAADNEFIVKELAEGDRIMLASDGITGDWEYEFLSDSEMRDAFSRPQAQSSSARFLELSKKHDDKTCIVIDVAGSAVTDDPRDGWRPIAPQVPPMVGDIEMEPIEQRTRVLGDAQPVTPEPVQQRTADETKVATGGLMSRVKRAVSPVLGPIGLYADGTSSIKPLKDSPAPTPAPVTQAKNPDVSARANQAKEAEQAATTEFYKIQDRVRLLEAEPEKLYAYTHVSEADRQAGITVSDFDKTVTSIREQMNNMAPDMHAGFETAIRKLQDRVAEIVAEIEARKRLESLQADAK